MESHENIDQKIEKEKEEAEKKFLEKRVYSHEDQIILNFDLAHPHHPNPKGVNKLYLSTFSKNFAGERRIYVIEMTKERGKSSTHIGNMIGVWKVDQNNQWHYEKKPHRFIAKIVTERTEEELGERIDSLEKEVIFAQENIPIAEFKKIIIGNSSHIPIGVARTAMAGGISLDKIILREWAAKNKEVLSDLIAKHKAEYSNAPLGTDKEKWRERLEFLENLDEETNPNHYTTLTDVQRIKLCLAICKALQEHFHDKDIIHLDIKPGNIMVDLSDPDNPKAKFVDFEYSANANEHIPAVGTYTYTSPEILLDENFSLKATPTKDLFPLGITLFEILGGFSTSLEMLIPDHKTIKQFANHIADISKNYKHKGSQLRSTEIKRTINYHAFILKNGRLPKKREVDAMMTLDNTSKNPMDKLLKYFKDSLTTFAELDSTRIDNVTLEKFITKLEKTRREIDDKVQDQMAVNASADAADFARDKLRAMGSNGNYDEIHTIISTHLMNDEVKDTPESIAEFIYTLDVQVLKDWYAKQDRTVITKKDVMNEIDRIIDNYKYYEENYRLLEGRDKSKVQIRYEKYNKEIEKTQITLDRMEALNKNNEEAFTSLRKLRESRMQLIKDIQGHQESLPKWFKDHQDIARSFDDHKDYADDDHRGEFFNSLISTCSKLQKNSALKKEQPESYLLICAIANYSNNRDKWSGINSLKRLLIAQQKSEAIAHFIKERERATHEVKYYANDCLIKEIENSDVDTSLASILWPDGSVMNKSVKSKNKDGTDRSYKLPGMPYVSIKEALSYNTGHSFTEVTSLKKLNKFRENLIDVDAFLSHENLTAEEKAEKDFLTSKINMKDMGKEGKIILDFDLADLNPDPNTVKKLYISTFSKHVTEERRIYVIEMTKKKGKKSTNIGNMMGVWKIDKDGHWRYEKKPDRFIAKIVTEITAENVVNQDRFIESLRREVNYAQASIPTSEFKDLAESEFNYLTEEGASSNINIGVARTALAAGTTLSYTIHLEWAARNPTKLQQLINDYEELIKSNRSGEIKEIKKRLNDLKALKLKAENYVPLTDEQRIKLCLAICKALQEHFHDKGIIHRDIKPGNIMVDLNDRDNPKVKFIDFEFSVDTSSTIFDKAGTPSYCFPVKQYVANNAIDLFPLGITLLEILAGFSMDMRSYIASALNVKEIASFDKKIGEVSKEIYVVHKLKEEAINQEINKDIFLLENGRYPDEEQLNDMKLSDEKPKGVMEPLIKYFKDSITARAASPNNNHENYSLEKFIQELEAANYKIVEEQMPIQDVITAYNEANLARNELRAMGAVTAFEEEDIRGSYPEIRRAISTHLMDKKVKDEPDSIAEFIHTLNVQVLKDWYAKQADPTVIKKQDVMNEVNRIIDDYKYYIKNSGFLYGRDKMKVQIRYQKYAEEIEKTQFTLDRMEDLNKKNEQTFKRYRDPAKPHAMPVANRREPRNHEACKVDIEAEFKAMTDDFSFGDDRQFEDIINECEAQYNAHHDDNYLNDIFFSRRKYEVDLIYRACHTYRNLEPKPNPFFQSLTELLNYQQKLDVIALCDSVIVKCEIKLGQHPQNKYIQRKQVAYERLRNAMEAYRNDHSISMHMVLACYRKYNEGYFDFFQKKINNHGFFHVVEDSGDFFNKVCSLPHPSTFLTHMKKQPELVILSAAKDL